MKEWIIIDKVPLEDEDFDAIRSSVFRMTDHFQAPLILPSYLTGNFTVKAKMEKGKWKLEIEIIDERMYNPADG